MGRISFDELEKLNEQKSQGNWQNDPKRERFFGLADNGDYAIVRILHTGIENFDILAVHDVEVQGRKKRISCLRSSNEPTANCPLCAAGNKPSPRIFIHMLQYNKDAATGALTTEHVVFDRGYSYAQMLKQLVIDYCEGTDRPFYDYVFKVVRQGAKGSTDTKYIFNVMPKFDSASHPYTVEDLEYNEVLGTIVWDKPFEDINTFLATGDFPKRDDDTDAPTSTNRTQPQAQPQTQSYPQYPVGPRTRV